MSDLNRCDFIGRLGQDPELRYTKDGKAVANLSLAVSETWKDKQGQKQEKTEWVRVSAFGRLAEIMGEYLRKGSQVYVSGKMQTRKWQDNNGQDRYTTEILANEMQMLGSGGGTGAGGNQPTSSGARTPNTASTPHDFDDDLPF